MKPKFFIGVDISKLTLDMAFLSGNEVIAKAKIENTNKAIRSYLDDLRHEFNCKRSNTIICAEQMGIFATFLVNSCRAKRYVVCLESPLQIKRSLGIQRGKNDALDAIRIAQYASKNTSTLKEWQPPRTPLQELKVLSTIRKRLLRVKVILGGNNKTEAYYWSQVKSNHIKKYSAEAINTIIGGIENVENEMQRIIANDSRLSRLMELITSVPTIGEVIALEMIICTNEFESIKTPKKFASYCGIAPFEWTSGTSVKGKARVSHIANKEIKSLLHMASMANIRRKESFLARYYNRKVAEGKNKMSVLNAIRNKLVHRVYACIREDKPYVEISK